MAALSVRHAFLFVAFAALTVLFLHLRVVVGPYKYDLAGSGADPGGGGGGVTASKVKAMETRPASHLDLPSILGARTALLAFHSATQPAHAPPVELAFYEDVALGRSSIKRVLIQIHGRGKTSSREAWVNWQQAAKARKEAADNSHDRASVKDTLVVAPIFFNGDDKDKYGWSGKGSTGPLLVWKGNGWGAGEANQYPHRQKTISSFEALDALLRYYSDRERFPNVEHIVVSGHSLGGQLVHRYAILSDLPVESPFRISFIVANPSTFLYLDGDRPRHNEDAAPAKLGHGYNHYKYGLEGIADELGEYYEGLHTARHGGPALWHRFAHEREVHYINGKEDHGVGDERPAAYAQGKDRMDRLKNYIAWASSPKRGGSWPEKHTVDWAPGVEHDAGGILRSDAGQRWAFLD